jgi:hypothetical protein
VQGAAAQLGALVRADADLVLLGDVLARQRARIGPDPLRTVVLAADLADGTRARLALLGGAPLAGSGQALHKELDELEVLSPLDQRVLGALVGLPEGEVYSSDLLDLVRASLAALSTREPEGSMQDDWVAACRRALDDLVARGDDERAEKLLRELRKAAQRTLHPLRRELASKPGGSWPPPPGQGEEPLVEPFERRLE